MRISKKILSGVAIVLVVGVCATLAWGYQARWLPRVKTWIANQVAVKSSTDLHEDHHDNLAHGEHGHDDHGHAGHDDGNTLHLSEQARKNIGLTDDKLQPIRLGEFTRTLNVPARVIEQPGRTKIQVAAPMTGVIVAMYAVQGESIQPGTLLFKIRLTHEDLVQTQTTYLAKLGELDVEKREIARLKVLDEQGVIAGKTLLKPMYSKMKLEAILGAYREALLLHGLSSKQIDEIDRDRRLLREVNVYAPLLHSNTKPKKMVRKGLVITPISSSAGAKAGAKIENSIDRPFVVQQINVHTGVMVRAGDSIAVLADLRELYIEGNAFEHDSDEITHAARMQATGETGWGVTAVLENKKRGSGMIKNLKIAYVDNAVEANSRALRFFVGLPNRVVHKSVSKNNHQFLTWQYKPGQRVQLRVPIEQWKGRIVLPVDAIAQDGAEKFAFMQNGDHFDRVSVHVEYQDQFSVVIANDGSLFPGDVVAMTGAHLMQITLKNKAGGAVDPHAGHSH